MYISVPKDVLAVKKKVLFGLDWLQLGICVVGIVPASWMLANFYSYSTNIAALLFALVFAPFGFLAFYNKNGQPAYVLAQLFIRQKFRRPPIRPKSYIIKPKLKKGGSQNATNKIKNTKKSTHSSGEQEKPFKIQVKPAHLSGQATKKATKR